MPVPTKWQTDQPLIVENLNDNTHKSAVETLILLDDWWLNRSHTHTQNNTILVSCLFRLRVRKRERELPNDMQIFTKRIKIKDTERPHRQIKKARTMRGDTFSMFSNDSSSILLTQPCNVLYSWNFSSGAKVYVIKMLTRVLSCLFLLSLLLLLLHLGRLFCSRRSFAFEFVGWPLALLLQWTNMLARCILSCCVKFSTVDGGVRWWLRVLCCYCCWAG